MFKRFRAQLAGAAGVSLSCGLIAALGYWHGDASTLHNASFAIFVSALGLGFAGIFVFACWLDWRGEQRAAAKSECAR